MLDTKKEPPASFGVFLTPLGSGGHRPRIYLGRAVPPPGGNDPESGDPPRYLLDFTIPDLRPGTYTYELWCDASAGKRGTLIGDPASRPWRLTIRPPGRATARRPRRAGLWSR